MGADGEVALAKNWFKSAGDERREKKSFGMSKTALKKICKELLPKSVKLTDEYFLDVLHTLLGYGTDDIPLTMSLEHGWFSAHSKKLF